MKKMNEFDPKNDVIDRYLKGELGEAELKAFEDELQRDAELKKYWKKDGWFTK